MKVANIGNLDINNDILKNPNDYVRIKGTFYKKDDKRIIKTSEGYKLYKKGMFTMDHATDKEQETKRLSLLKFIDKDGNKQLIHTSNLKVSLVDKMLINEVFHDIKASFKNDYSNEKFSNKDRFYISELMGILIKVSHKNSLIVMRHDQIEKFGFKELLSEPGRIVSMSEYKSEWAKRDQALQGNYLRCNVSKFNRKESNLNSISKDDLTFGVEIETSAGSISSNLFKLRNVDVECSRDGSITGGEYVTGILNKDSGFYDLYNILDVVNQRCITNDTCGIHVHVGNTVFSKRFTNLAYILGYKIQDELFGFLHKSRSNNNMCGLLLEEHYNVGVKSYKMFNNKKMSDNFFYSYLYDKMLYDRNFVGSLQNKKNPHPGNRYCGRYQDPFRGEITPQQFRYKWLNLISCTFNQRNGRVSNKKGEYPYKYLTLEFRPYQASLDYQEIEDWILFCKAFVKFIVNKSYKILTTDKITVKDIILESYDNELYDRMNNRISMIGRKNTYPENLSFTQFLNHRNKINNKIHVPNNIQEAIE